MLNTIFDINKFNIFSDDDNYYFFRALNTADNADIENGIIVNEDGRLEKIRTDRDRFAGTPKYAQEDDISLEQVTDHIKVRQLKQTNCISLTSNANTALTYGRKYYKDKYVMIKVPKTKLGVSTYEAGLYMLEQIQTVIDNTSRNDTTLKSYFDRIDMCHNKEELENLKQVFLKQNNIDLDVLEPEISKKSDLFEEGFTYEITNSMNYIALNDEQNLAKNKLFLKLDLLHQQILPKISNRLLIQTIGNAFSSLELIHYGEIQGNEIIEVPKEIVDIFGLLQQMPSDLEYVGEIKSFLLRKIQEMRFTGNFTYKDFDVEDKALSAENLYKITGGRISYGDAVDLYKEAFYLAKSKLRTKRSVQVLKRLLENPKYDKTLNYMLKNGYGIEPEITTRLSNGLVNVSESVGIDISAKNASLVDYINSLNEQYLTYILDSPNNAFEMLFPKILEKNSAVPRQEWIADAMIDMLDLSRFGIKFNLRDEQRQKIKNALIEHNVEQVYFYLKRQNVKEKDIANVLFTNMIKNNDTVNLNDTFTLAELEWFIGYNRVQGTGLNLRKYQVPVVKNINTNFETRNFTAVVLPTATGKSYIALAEMYQFEKMINKLNTDRHAKILYLAPNDEILNQLKDIIRETYQPEVHLTDKDRDMDIKRIFPNLVLSTYQNLKDRTDSNNNLKEIFTSKYDLIILDEIHRTGAKEWQNLIDELITNQDPTVKVLGITATPVRDMDFKDMTQYWARKFGYTKDEILQQKHLSYNLDIVSTIEMKIVSCPKVINCIYNLKNNLNDLKFSIDEIKNDEVRKEKLIKYEKIRRAVDSAMGIEQVLNENIKQNGKYIIFLPVTRKCEDEDGNATYYDEDGNEIKQFVAYQIIRDYQILFHQYLFSDEYLKDNPNIKIIYNKIINNTTLNEAEINYLTMEKENVLLLSKFEMKHSQNDLISTNDLLANEIIRYMKWDKLSKKELSSKLREKMQDRIEDYSMLGSYGAKANKVMLDKFNEQNTNGKTKLMFVMNKLNEGVHVKGISGIVWMRALDENSRILFFQQLGRGIKSLDEGEILDENNIPVVIDLVNNSLKVKLNKNHSLEQDDLDNIIMVKNWMMQNNKIPNGKSLNREEVFLARKIVELQNRYLKYIVEPDLLKDNMDYERSIVKIGGDIDIWDTKIEFNESEKRNYMSKDKEEDTLVGLLELEAVVRDFVDLKQDVDVYNLSRFDYYYDILLKLREQGDSTNLAPADKVRVKEDGTVEVVKKKLKRIDGKRVFVNEEEYKAADLIAIGFWLSDNDSRSKFDEDQKAKLRKVGYILNEDKGNKKDFDYYYDILLKLQEQGDSTDLSAADKVRVKADGTVEVVKRKIKYIDGKQVIANEEEYKAEDLIAIGNWLSKNSRQSKFDEDQKAKLREVGYVLTEDKKKRFAEADTKFNDDSTFKNVVDNMKNKKVDTNERTIY